MVQLQYLGAVALLSDALLDSLEESFEDPFLVPPHRVYLKVHSVVPFFLLGLS